MPTSPSARSIEVNGASIQCTIAGTGDSVVLVHSGITDSHMWDPQVEVLAERFRVVRYDLCGFGRSSIPPEPYTHHEDLHGVFRTLDLGPAVLIGASYGGDVATAFALEYPELTRALILVNSLVGMTEPSSGL
ncbi:MAG TPA: alpha/beta hydrolase, partial [Thermomicrobiales bacterium]|nr:alpha/beta hydrolase [Thermomicrobiales bacterium]